MADSKFLSDSYFNNEEVSLRLMPLQQLKEGTSYNRPPPLLIRANKFEILGPEFQEKQAGIIDTLVKLGVTKAKIYAAYASEEAIKHFVIVKPVVTNSLWGSIKSFFSTSSTNTKDSLEESDQKHIPIDSDDYIIIERLEEPPQTVTSSQEEDSASMMKSSLIFSSSLGLKSINKLRRKDGLSDLSSSENWYKLVDKDDPIFQSSFNFSEDSIVYAPEVHSSLFKVINCQATNFDLVGNSIFIQDIEKLFETSVIKVEQDDKKSDDTDSQQAEYST